MKKKSDSSDRTRQFFFICYPESLPSPIDVCIRASCPDAYAYILHDSDYDINNQLKKLHYHVYLKFQNPRSYSSIGKQFGVASNLVEYCRSPKASIRYMLHLDDPDKTSYYPSDIHSKNVPLDKYLKDNNENVDVLLLIERLQSHQDKTFGDFVAWTAVNNLYSVFRRSASTYRDIFYHG